MQILDIVVVGAGLTGLSTAHQLSKGSKQFLVLEKQERAGGQIRTLREEGFVIESGPNTGIISTPEVAELFDDFPGLLQTAQKEAQRRLILKDGKFRPLPSGLKSALSTSLFTWVDKLRILREPWVKASTDPNESIANLVRRRLGESYYRYAVDPFVGGIYAGDPEKLITRYALPKLYALEANYGSFIRGAMAVMKRKKSPREQRANKAVFSAVNGLSSLSDAISQRLLDRGLLHLGVEDLRANYDREQGLWCLSYTQSGTAHTIYTRQVITSIGTHELIDLLSPLEDRRLDDLRAMRYAPIVQVAVGYRTAVHTDFEAFGGLIPSAEDREVLGILNPSASFLGRCPEGGMLLSVFLGGMRSPQLIQASDDDIKALVVKRLEQFLGIYQQPDLIKIFRHERAIPQYEASTEQRLILIQQLENDYPQLLIGGNMLNGIGMPDRIKQGFDLALRASRTPQ